MIVDMGYYNNDFVQFFVPIVFHLLLIFVYANSIYETQSFHRLFMPNFPLFSALTNLKKVASPLLPRTFDKSLLKRALIGIMISVPFLFVFSLLLRSADSQFGQLFTKLFDFQVDFEFRYLMSVPLVFILYLLLFVYSFTSHKKAINIVDYKKMDIMIVGIFLALINLLFISFIALQVPFLLNSTYLPTGVNVSEFARQGFFELMMVMGLVLLIFLFIARRYRGEKIVTFLLSGLLIQTIMMGVVSLKKMYLYQSIKGATLLRYYVEWFDYFLILVLAIGMVFFIKRFSFDKLLDTVFAFGTVAFVMVSSINIDALVAKTNLEKFKDTPQALDKQALVWLSIDALPAVLESKLSFVPNETLYFLSERDECKNFASYHYGYCQKLKLRENK